MLLLKEQKLLYRVAGPNQDSILPLFVRKAYHLEILRIDSDREENLASNDIIINESGMNISSHLSRETNISVS